MLHLNEFIIGFLVGILTSVIIFGSKMYIYYKEKNLLDKRIKRLEKANSINDNQAELSVHYQQMVG
jgi:hypothetical protein